ncbi:MAG: hypothetical protein HDS31_02120 [Bacteroides sp.]|nr:hypothetical protein [Bacteroides sp.]
MEENKDQDQKPEDPTAGCFNKFRLIIELLLLIGGLYGIAVSLGILL